MVALGKQETNYESFKCAIKCVYETFAGMLTRHLSVIIQYFRIDLFHLLKYSIYIKHYTTVNQHREEFSNDFRLNS